MGLGHSIFLRRPEVEVEVGGGLILPAPRFKSEMLQAGVGEGGRQVREGGRR